ncbi:MAG: hypothetical protein Q9159_000558 [Coniocarpon cinnabarinum]
MSDANAPATGNFTAQASLDWPEPLPFNKAPLPSVALAEGGYGPGAGFEHELGLVRQVNWHSTEYQQLDASKNVPKWYSPPTRRCTRWKTG